MRRISCRNPFESASCVDTEVAVMAAQHAAKPAMLIGQGRAQVAPSRRRASTASEGMRGPSGGTGRGGWRTSGGVAVQREARGPRHARQQHRRRRVAEGRRAAVAVLAAAVAAGDGPLRRGFRPAMMIATAATGTPKPAIVRAHPRAHTTPSVYLPPDT